MGERFECPECGRRLEPEDVCPEDGISPHPPAWEDPGHV